MPGAAQAEGTRYRAFDRQVAPELSRRRMRELDGNRRSYRPGFSTFKKPAQAVDVFSC